MTTNEIAQAIYLVTKDKKDTDLKNSINKVISFLSKKRLLLNSSLILENLNKIIDRNEGRIRVHLKSVKKLNEETKKAIINLLKKHYSSKEIVFIESIDASLLGGVRIELDNEVIDLSTKNKLGQLKNYLQKV